MPVKDPELEHLAFTLDALPEQTHPPREVLIVDSSEPPLEVEADGIDTTLIHAPDLGIAQARQRGVAEASGDYILELDEDAVLVQDTYIEDALARLQQPDVVAAGGVVLPIRGNPEGKAIALADRFNPADLGTHNLVYPRRLCADGSCFPMDHRGEDLTVRAQLQGQGRIARMDDQPVLKDLPTTRQRAGRNTLLGAFAGAVIGGVASQLTRQYIRQNDIDLTPGSR